jgi:hypothetical protein
VLAGLFRLRIPFQQPSTVREHETNLYSLSAWSDQLPIFAPHMRTSYSLSSWSTSSSVYVDFAGGGETLAFSKLHPQTDVEVSILAAVFQTGSAGRVEIGVQVDAGTTFDVAKRHSGVGSATAQASIVGMRILDRLDIRPGRHTLTVRAKVGAGTLNTDASSHLELRVCEVVPVEALQ